MNNVAISDSLPVSVKSISTTFLPASPSCMQFCPFDSTCLIVGTYTLDQTGEESETHAQAHEPQSRQGSLLALRLEADFSTKICTTTSVNGGALHLEFSPHDPHTLAVATSTGRLVLMTIDGHLNLQVIHDIEVYTDGVLALYLSWHPHPRGSNLLAITGSDGSVLVFDSHARSTLARFEAAHSLEAWIVVWKSFPESQNDWELFSGGDDSVISLLDFRVEGNDAEMTTRIADRKTHSAGVTYILPLPTLDQDLILTGSYDDRLRLLRPTSARWQCLAEIDLGGGVWRLKTLDSCTHPKKRLVVLASCMYAGARIVEAVQSSNEEWTMNILAIFVEHESMNYASDALVDQSGSQLTTTIVSTSFYDKRLCVWQWQNT